MEMLCRSGMASGAFASAGLVRQGRGRLILEIDTASCWVVVIADDIVGVQFFDRPRAAGSGGRSNDRSGLGEQVGIVMQVQIGRNPPM